MATVTIMKPAKTTVTRVSTPGEEYKPPPGRLGNLTGAQSKALETLKAEIKAEGWFVEERMDDHLLLRCVVTCYRSTSPYLRIRFLRARKFDVALAKKMLKECEEWRTQFGIDELMKSV